MEDQAAGLLATLKKTSAPIDHKLTQFNSLKSSIKHERVPQECTPTIFECVRLAIAAQTSTTLVSTGFSTLGHLVKRLNLQSQTQIITQQSNQLLPTLLDRLGDARENHRNAASQSLSDLWPYNHPGVEGIVRDGALGGTNSRAKEIAMQWVVKVREHSRARFFCCVTNKLTPHRCTLATASLSRASYHTLSQTWKIPMAWSERPLNPRLWNYSGSPAPS